MISITNKLERNVYRFTKFLKSISYSAGFSPVEQFQSNTYFKCEYLRNQEEFKQDFEENITPESMQSITTYPSTIIPQQCGNLSVEDWSSLSNTQKKRAKAKIKTKAKTRNQKS